MDIDADRRCRRPGRAIRSGGHRFERRPAWPAKCGATGRRRAALEREVDPPAIASSSWSSRPHSEELEAAHCWLDHDRVPGRPEVTEFRRAVRYHNANVARGQRVSDRDPSDPAGYAASPGRQPPRPRLRTRERVDLPHHEGRRRRPGSHVVRRAAPDLRPPELLGRSALLRGAGGQPVRRPRSRSGSSRPGHPQLVAGGSGPGHGRAIRALARPLRPELLQQPPFLRRRVRSRAARRVRRSPRDRRQVSRGGAADTA